MNSGRQENAANHQSVAIHFDCGVHPRDRGVGFMKN
jgi:hypothetical protein